MRIICAAAAHWLDVMVDLAAVPAQDTVVRGDFWPEPVRVIRATSHGASVRIEAVGITNGVYYDRTLTTDQLQTLVHTERAAAHSFDADPTLFRLATEALRTQLAHAFDPQFAVSVSQVDPLPHQLDAVYRHMLALPRIRFLLADDPGADQAPLHGRGAGRLVRFPLHGRLPCIRMTGPEARFLRNSADLGRLTYHASRLV